MYRFLTSLYAIFSLSCLTSPQADAQTPVGQWSDYLPWRPAVAVTVKADKIYCATSQGLFSVTTGADEEISRYSKINGLHDIGISAIAAGDDEILIAYRNSNIDLLSGNNSFNIPDLMRKQVAADKSIFHIFYYNNNAYLCTGLGIVVVNTSIPEIAATYVVGSTGEYTPVYSLAFLNGSLYAATSEGIRTAALNSNNPSDYRNWSTLNQGLQQDTIQEIISFNNQLICRQGNQLFRFSNNTWTSWYTDGWHINNIDVHGSQLFLSEQQSGGAARIIVLDAGANLIKTLQHQLIDAPLQTANTGNETWIADSLQGLIRYKTDDNSFTAIHPDAPASIITGNMLFVNNTLWATAGSVSSDWKASGNSNGYYTYSQGSWTQFDHNTQPALESVSDLITLSPDPGSQGCYLGSFGGGLIYAAPNGGYTIFKQGVLPPVANNPNAYNVSGLTTDATGNLWLAAYGASGNLLLKKPDNTWVSFRSPYVMTGNAISQLLTDDYGLVYMVSPQSNGLFVLNHNNTLDNKNDDQWRQYRLGSNQGNLPSNDVYCLAKDKNGSIWVGTARGIAIINCPGQAAAEGCNAILPIIQQDNFAGYLFQDEQVTSIAIDGANRKWVGTLNGAWLVSEEGDQILQQFNTSNSPLPDNHIYTIAIDPQTGEIYFATGKGLMSWHGTATAPVSSMTRDSVLVFPNPVPHNYSGTIAIRGLVQNTRVKITDISGKMVFQTRAFGGQAIWNGLDYTGHRPQSGVYLVFAASETGGEHMVTKIVFIN
ncbi:two-component regulator propeller domain-containing protein [Chitinophaga sp. CF418]|uniref:type IX secretion system anionic LPS delivery protein PorZ n=1 Tax=Chitinophaga sp. CF418 TaxID=1855287 RepID=UPI00091BDC08|nr:two-component regulator propeller domain-containing protein [Chitinophaga sp. CF418]SHM57745.1 Por secretion system C-terminal sorting domain-containing protein [Chitinophaga sp. CF418]